MPLLFIAIGTVFLIAALSGTVSDAKVRPGLITLLKGDFTGPKNFIVWAAAIYIVGAIGYLPGMRTLSTAFLLLLFLVLFLTNGNPNQAGGGFFAMFNAGLQSTTTGALTPITMQTSLAAIPITNTTGLVFNPLPSLPNF